eukprot:scaffold180864_cov16-Tisochrysis_lutea.AAC.1
MKSVEVKRAAGIIMTPNKGGLAINDRFFSPVYWHPLSANWMKRGGAPDNKSKKYAHECHLQGALEEGEGGGDFSPNQKPICKLLDGCLLNKVMTIRITSPENVHMLKLLSSVK